jgi:hypothetical protein
MSDPTKLFVDMLQMREFVQQETEKLNVLNAAVAAKRAAKCDEESIREFVQQETEKLPLLKAMLSNQKKGTG